MKPYTGTVCENCSSREGPFQRRFSILGSDEYTDGPAVCGYPRRYKKTPDEKAKRIAECVARRAKIDAAAE